MKRIILLMMLCSIASLGFAQVADPVSWKFSSEEIAPLTFKIKFEATIKEPYHIYPQSAFGSGLGMPTEFLFVEDPNVEFIGEVKERGIDQESEEQLPYYSKVAVFTQTLKLDSAKKTTLAFTIKYMACTKQMCLPPSSKQFTVELNGKDKVKDVVTHRE